MLPSWQEDSNQANYRRRNVFSKLKADWSYYLKTHNYFSAADWSRRPAADELGLQLMPSGVVKNHHCRIVKNPTVIMKVMFKSLSYSVEACLTALTVYLECGQAGMAELCCEHCSTFTLLIVDIILV